ncbi:unnamed protein product [Rhodiola kirilowii]
MVANTAFTRIGNPNDHLTSFLELCETFKINNVPKESICLKLFPFSLMGKAKDWLWSNEASTFTTWDELAQAFLLQYFPPAKTQRLKNLINSFEQGEDDTFQEAWERFKELQRECPHHNIDKPTLIQTFYQGMDAESKRQMDQVAGEAFMELHPTNGGAIRDKNHKEFPPMVCAICTSSSHREDECPHTFPPEETENTEEVHFLQRKQVNYGKDWDHPNFSYMTTEPIKYDANWHQKSNPPPDSTREIKTFKGKIKVTIARLSRTN